MAEVVIVNGPPGVGKSAVAAAFRTLLPGSVAISGTALRGFAPPDARAHLGGGATYRVAGALSKAFLELGAPRVIFDYVFLRAAQLRYFREALPLGQALSTFTLWAPVETVLARAATQPVPLESPAQARGYYAEMWRNAAELGQFVQCEVGTAGEAASRIHELLAQAAVR